MYSKPSRLPSNLYEAESPSAVTLNVKSEVPLITGLPMIYGRRHKESRGWGDGGRTVSPMLIVFEQYIFPPSVPTNHEILGLPFANVGTDWLTVGRVCDEEVRVGGNVDREREGGEEAAHHVSV